MKTILTWRIILLVIAMMSICIAMVYYAIKESKVIQKRFIDAILKRARNLAKNDVKDAKRFLERHLPSMISLNYCVVPKEFNLLRIYTIQAKKRKLRCFQNPEKYIKNALAENILEQLIESPE